MLRRIALLLHSLPERTHRALLGQLTSDEKQRIQCELDSLGEVDPMEQYRALSVLRDQLQAETVVVEKVESEIQDEILIGRARLSKKPIASLHRTTSTNASAPSPAAVESGLGHEPVSSQVFDFLAQLEVEECAAILNRETPEVVAVCLSKIDPRYASTLLPKLTEELRAHAVRRLAGLGEATPEMLHAIAARLETQIRKPERSAQMTSESFEQFAERFGASEAPGALEESPMVVPFRDTSSSRRRLPAHHGSPEQLDTDRQAEKVDRVLASLSPKELCRALGMVSTEQAFFVLCGLPNDRAESILALLPRRQSRKVRADMRRLGTLQLSEIDAAKLVVAQVALRLTVAPQRIVA